jgi:hypothetical protein
VSKVTCPANVRENIDLGPLLQAPRTSVSAGLFGPAFACSRCLYHSVSLSASPPKGQTVSPVVPILGLITQVVLFDGGLLRFGGGDGDFDHEDGVVCLWLFWGSARVAAALAKDSVLCLAPGLRAFLAAVWYSVIAWAFVYLWGILCWKANIAWEMIAPLLIRWSSSFE